MKIRVIADSSGAIKSFSIRPPDYDPKKSGEIFPCTGHVAHDLAMPQEHQHLFTKEPHKIPATLQIGVVAGKAALIPRQKT